MILLHMKTSNPTLLRERSPDAKHQNWARHSRMPPVRAPVTLVLALTHAAGTHTGTHFTPSSVSKCEAAGQIQSIDCAHVTTSA